MQDMANVHVFHLPFSFISYFHLPIQFERERKTNRNTGTDEVEREKRKLVRESSLHSSLVKQMSSLSFEKKRTICCYSSSQLELVTDEKEGSAD